MNAGLKVLTDATEYVFVMDADHHPVPIHTMLAILIMEQNGYDVVQVCSRTRNVKASSSVDRFCGCGTIFQPILAQLRACLRSSA